MSRSTVPNLPMGGGGNTVDGAGEGDAVGVDVAVTGADVIVAGGAGARVSMGAGGVVVFAGLLQATATASHTAATTTRHRLCQFIMAIL